MKFSISHQTLNIKETCEFLLSIIRERITDIGEIGGSDFYYSDKELLEFSNSLFIRTIKSIGLDNLTSLPDVSSAIVIDEAMAIFLITLTENTRSNISLLSIDFVILMRDYLNLFGWINQSELLMLMGEDAETDVSPYTEISLATNLPDIANDFLSNFISLNTSTMIRFEEFKEITSNFCQWLLANNLTDLKLFINDSSTYDLSNIKC